MKKSQAEISGDTKEFGEHNKRKLAWVAGLKRGCGVNKTHEKLKVRILSISNVHCLSSLNDW